MKFLKLFLLVASILIIPCCSIMYRTVYEITIKETYYTSTYRGIYSLDSNGILHIFTLQGSEVILNKDSWKEIIIKPYEKL